MNKIADSTKQEHVWPSALLWAGSRRGCPSLGDCGPLRLGVDTVVPSNDVRVLGVTLSSDLTMDKHVYLLGWFLSAAAIAAVTKLRVSGDARSCLRYVPHRLL